MFTLQQQKSLELLDKYLAETPKEVIQAEIDAITAMQFEGPSVKDYFQNFHKAFIHEAPKTRKRPTRVNNESIFRIKKGDVFHVTNHITITANNNIQNKYGKYAKKTATNKILTSNVHVTSIENQNKRNTI